jgi:serine/threonine-protein kinase
VKDALADRYIVEREIGRGGMATVYLAQDLKHNRPVAVKVLHPELATVLGPQRFLREIEITARLQHPHILPVHDSGEAGGFLFYVMPYVEGESMRDLFKRRGQLPLEEAVRFVREVAGALSYAHAREVVHRDIKPENILLSAGHAQVADFGVASAWPGPSAPPAKTPSPRRGPWSAPPPTWRRSRHRVAATSTDGPISTPSLPLRSRR